MSVQRGNRDFIMSVSFMENLKQVFFLIVVTITYKFDVEQAVKVIMQYDTVHTNGHCLVW